MLVAYAIIAMLSLLLVLQSVRLGQRDLALSQAYALGDSLAEKMDKQKAAQQKNTEALRQDLVEQKRALAAQKKKHFVEQQARRKIEAEAKDAQEQRRHAQEERPAFVAAEKDKDVPKSTRTVTQALAVDAEKLELAVKKAVAPLAIKLAQAQEESDKHLQELKKSSQDLRTQRRKVEDLRRIDLINRRQTELLEDKIKRLGRENYEMLSHIAVLKGEVALPGKSLEKARRPRPVHTPQQAAAPKPSQTIHA